MDWIGDPVFPGFLKRITDLPGQNNGLPNFVVGDILRHKYSKTSAWNADGSILQLPVNLKMSNENGDYVLRNLPQPGLFLDGKTYQPIFLKSEPAGTVWARWHPLISEWMYYARNTGSDTAEFGIWNVRSDHLIIIRRFTGLQFAELENAESNPSNDGRYVGLAFRYQGRSTLTGLVFEVYKDLILAEVDLSTAMVDNVSISSSGAYFVANGCWHGPGCTDWKNQDRTMIYKWNGDRTYQAIRYFSEYGRPSHFDYATDESGEDVVVGVSKCSNLSDQPGYDSSCTAEAGAVIKRRLRDGQITRLTPPVNGNRGGYASHTSTRNINRPGWAYVTYAQTPAEWGPYFDEVVAVPLDGSQKVQRLNRLFNTGSDHPDVDYWLQSQAVPSPDGRQVLFTSNWSDTLKGASYVATPCIDGKMLSP